MRYILGMIICLFVMLFVFSVDISFAANPDDWLKEAFLKSHDPGDGEPYSIKAEADDLFNTNINSNQIFDKNASANSDSIFVKMTRFLVRMAVMLAVPMFIYIAIKIVLAFGDDGKMNEAMKQAWYVAWGLLLALLSVMIIYLITSALRSSVDLFGAWFIFIG